MSPYIEALADMIMEQELIEIVEGLIGEMAF